MPAFISGTKQTQIKALMYMKEKNHICQVHIVRPSSQIAYCSRIERHQANGSFAN